MIAGHATSISLEPIFWDALAAAAVSESLPINALVARIDVARIAEPDPANLASAIRVWLFARAQENSAPSPDPHAAIVADEGCQKAPPGPA